MQTEQSDILAAALDNLVRFSVTGCGQAARRAAGLLERLSESPEADADMRRMYSSLSEMLILAGTEPTVPIQTATTQASRAGAWLTWEWVDGLGRLRGLAE